MYSARRFCRLLTLPQHRMVAAVDGEAEVVDGAVVAAGVDAATGRAGWRIYIV